MKSYEEANRIETRQEFFGGKEKGDTRKSIAKRVQDKSPRQAHAGKREADGKRQEGCNDGASCTGCQSEDSASTGYEN